MSRPGERYAAFLGGINLGKRRVKMAELREHFEALDVENVRTFIASGNVVFDAVRADASRLELELERHLADTLGFPTKVMVRRLGALPRITTNAGVMELRERGYDPHVIFLRETVGDDALRALKELESEDDRFRAFEREVVWFRRGRLCDSPIGTRQLATALGGVDHTMRNMNTVERMVARFGGG